MTENDVSIIAAALLMPFHALLFAYSSFGKVRHLDPTASL